MHEAGLAVRRAAAAAFAERVRPMVVEMRGRGLSLRKIAAELTEQGIRTPQDGTWAAGTVQRILGAACWQLGRALRSAPLSRGSIVLQGLLTYQKNSKNSSNRE
jgi:hypothetical protein